MVQGVAELSHVSQCPDGAQYDLRRNYIHQQHRLQKNSSRFERVGYVSQAFKIIHANWRHLELFRSNHSQEASTFV